MSGLRIPLFRGGEREWPAHYAEWEREIEAGLSMTYPNVPLVCRCAHLRLGRQKLRSPHSHEAWVPDVAEVLPGLHHDTRKRGDTAVGRKVLSSRGQDAGGLGLFWAAVRLGSSVKSNVPAAQQCSLSGWLSAGIVCGVDESFL